ncbi:MAG: hypothetical protein AB7I19_10300 [Planctomycetota bacterium]
MNGALQVLRVEVRSDYAAFVARVEELGSLALGPTTDDPGVLARAAVALHHAYGTIEAALARIAKVFQTDPSGANWHRSLLDTMAMEVPGIRPAIVSTAALPALRELLAFRHFFRHAYAVPLDAARLTALARHAAEVRALLQSDFERLDRWLAELAERT